jgi:hypothetical protein
MKKTALLCRLLGRKLLMGFAGMVLAGTCYAQARAQADVNIKTVTLTPTKPSRPTTIVENVPTRNQPGTNQPGTRIVAPSDNLKCAVTVHSYWDDDASQAMLVVVLPVEVSVISHPANAVVYKAGGTSPWAGYIVFSLGDMAVQQSITVEFTFTKSTTGNNKVSAYAYSATPDPNPSNNYKDASY